MLRKLVTFILLSYGLALCLDIILWMNLPGMGAPFSSLAMVGWASARMYVPALAAALSLAIEGRSIGRTFASYLRHDRRAIKLFLLSPLVVYLALGIYLILLASLNLLDVERPVRTMVRASMGLIDEETAKKLLLVQLVLSYPVALTLNSALTLGEELGWRGYLFELMGGRVNARSLLVVGIAWGLWHAPAIALLGHDYPELRLLGVPLFTVLCLLYSVPMLELTERAASVLPAVSLHGAINSLGGLFTLTVGLRGYLGELVGGLGITGMVAWGLVALIIHLLLRRTASPRAGMEEGGGSLGPA